MSDIRITGRIIPAEYSGTFSTGNTNGGTNHPWEQELFINTNYDNPRIQRGSSAISYFRPPQDLSVYEAEIANSAKSADKLGNQAAGSANEFIYFTGGQPKASGKSLATSISGTGADTTFPSTKAVVDYIKTYLGTSDAMVFKGTLGTGGTITALPATCSKGDTYRVITAGTYQSHNCEIGDLVIAVKDATTAHKDNWTVAQTNIDGAVVSDAANVGADNNPVYVSGSKVVASTADIGSNNVPIYMEDGVIKASTHTSWVHDITDPTPKDGKITVQIDGNDSTVLTVYEHPNHAALTGVPTTNATLSHGGTFKVSQPVVDALGHTTALNARTYTLPSETQLSKGTDTTGTAQSLSFGGSFTVMTDTSVSNHQITDTNVTFTLPSDRLFTTLVPTGTAIPKEVDLNTTTYLKVGRYYCSANATAATLVNCPTSKAFMMEVYSPLSTTIDNETTGTWVYRIRKITHYQTGVQYIQYCNTSGTANVWTYNPWYIVPRSPFTLDSTDKNDGSATLGASNKPIYVASDGTLTASTSTLGSNIKHIYMSNGTISESTANVGSDIKLTYLKTGEVTASNATVGTGSNPIFMTNGELTASSSTIGADVTPIYMNNGVITATAKTIGGVDTPMFMDAGVMKACSADIGATDKPIYMHGGTLKASTSTFGNSYTPMYMENGTIKACTKNFDEYLPLVGGTMVGNIIMDSSTATAQSGEPYIQWGDRSGNKPYIGFAHDQSDGTFVIASLEKDTTTYGVKNYKNGLSIGGSSGNLCWQGNRVVSAASATVGSGTKPVYIADGIATECGSSLAVNISGVAAKATILETARTIQTNLESTSSASFNGSANITPGVTGTLPIANGGTGATTAAGVLTNLGITATAAEINKLAGATFTVSGSTITGNLTGTASTATNANNLKINDTTANTNYYILGVTAGGGTNQTVYRAFNSAGTANNTGVYFNGTSGVLYGAAWNDYAEYRRTEEEIEAGRVVCETGKGDLVLSFERLQPGAEIVSDTFGFAIGETDTCKTPIAATGRVLAYPYEDRNSYKAGDAVCAGPNGTVSKMTREEVKEYPDRIIGTVSEIPNYEVWGQTNTPVNGRIWIRIK